MIVTIQLASYMYVHAVSYLIPSLMSPSVPMYNQSHPMYHVSSIPHFTILPAMKSWM